MIIWGKSDIIFRPSWIMIYLKIFMVYSLISRLKTVRNLRSGRKCDCFQIQNLSDCMDGQLPTTNTAVTQGVLIHLWPSLLYAVMLTNKRGDQDWVLLRWIGNNFQIKHSRLWTSSGSRWCQLALPFASRQKETYVIDCGFSPLPPSALVIAADTK